MKFLHSFVICAYKQSPFLEDCVISLINQKVESNIVITTSTPCDFIKKIAYKYKLKYIINERKPSGIAADWNFAYRSVLTDYVTLCHQDDIYLPEFSSHIKHAIKKYNDILLIFTGYSEISEKGEEYSNLNLSIKKLMLIPLEFGRLTRNIFVRRRILSLGSPICCPSVTYNKEMLNGFKFSSEFKCNLDWDAWEKISKRKGRFLYIPKPLMQHRIHKGSATTDLISSKIRSNEDLVMFRRFWP